jgi:nitroreductase
MDVFEALHSRRSLRAFLPREVAQADLEAILQAAARAPSGTNIQPWKVRVLSGAARQRLVDAVQAAYDDPAYVSDTEYDYYPREWVAPYIERRRKVGWDLYGLLGIEKTDKARMHAQHRRNFAFFDAPVGLIFSIDRVLSQGSWLDYGMFLQSLMLAARGLGLDTCAQAAWINHHRIVAQQLGFAPGEMLVCGMALGYADPAAPENQLRTERAGLGEFVEFFWGSEGLGG